MPRKKTKNKNFYIKDIGVLDWLKSTDEYQTHRYSDRIEHKKNYKLHREDGPAIEFFSGIGNQYYDEGSRLTEEEYTNWRRTLLIDKMTNG